MARLILVTPAMWYLPAYADALRRGWSPDETRDQTRLDELQRIAEDPLEFLASLEDREAKDGLPGFRHWMWDGEFAGSIGFRWQPGTADLPPTCLGHIGYGVAPWKRGRGYATAALGLLLAEARKEGLPYVELTTDVENVPSQRVILGNGGTFVERFDRGPAYGNSDGLRYRIML